VNATLRVFQAYFAMYVRLCRKPKEDVKENTHEKLVTRYSVIKPDQNRIV